MTESAKSAHHSRSLLTKRWLFVMGLAAWVLAISGTVAYWITSNGSAARNGATLVSGLSAGGSQNFDQPRVQIFKQTRELGPMLASEDRTAEFFLRNIGGKPLEISNVRTSCPCTHAQVVIFGETGEEKSPRFNEEKPSSPDTHSWKGMVDTGGTATVRVTYKPALAPIKGPVSTTVTLGTNDPNRPVIELQIHATVE